MRDDHDFLVPEQLEHIFAECERMDDFAVELRILRREVHDAAAACPDAWSYFNMREFDDLMEYLINVLAAGKPYVVCRCRGADANCRLCQGRGVLTKPGMKQAIKYGLWSGVTDENL